MPNEPERPVEKLLRDYAERRRGEAEHDFELHPASRRLLQDEVARVHAGKEQKEGWFPGSWVRLWPTLGYGLATMAALGLVVKLMLPGVAPIRTVGQLAKNENAAAPVLAKASPEAPAQAVNAPALAIAQPEPPTGAVNLALADQKEPISRDASALSEIAQLQTGKDLAVMSQKHADNQVLSRAPAAPQSKTFMLSQSEAETGAQLGRTEAPQQFLREQLQQREAGAKWSNTLPSSQILASFRVELNGQELRIIDKDGSIYTGSIATPGAGASTALSEGVKADSSLASATAISKERRMPQQSNVSFRVAGTNLSLKQPLVFRGQLLPVVQASAGVTNNVSTTTIRRSLGMAAPTAPIGEYRVVGAAAIAGGAEIQINALPSK